MQTRIRFLTDLLTVSWTSLSVDNSDVQLILSTCPGPYIQDFFTGRYLKNGGRFFPVFFARFDGFWAPLGPEVDPEGVPEIAFVGIRLGK